MKVKKMHKYSRDLLLEFYKEYNRFPKKHESYKGVYIGHFFEDIKLGYIFLTPYEKSIFVKNASFSENEQKIIIKERVNLLIKFFNERLRLPDLEEIYEGVNIGEFLELVEAKKINIPPKDIILLEEIGVFSNATHKKVVSIIKFYHLYKRWPKGLEKFGDTNVGYLYTNIKNGMIDISSKDRKVLEKLGFFSCVTHNKVVYLHEFYNLYRRYPKLDEIYKGENIGDFYHRIRRGEVSFYDKNDISLLLECKIKVKMRDEKRNLNLSTPEEKVNLLFEFYDDKCRWPKRGEGLFKGNNMDSILRGIKYGTTPISKEDRKKLEDKGFIFCNKK